MLCGIFIVGFISRYSIFTKSTSYITVYSRKNSNLDQNAVNNLQTNCLWVDLNGDFNNSYMKPSIIATEDASTLDGSPITSGAFYAFRKVYYLGSKVVVELLESYPNPGRIWTSSYDKNQGSWGAWNSSQNYLPLSGGTVDGVLKVGANLELKSDGEGGNMSWYASDGTHWEIDSYNGDCRLFKYDPVVVGLHVTKDGYIYDGHGNYLQNKAEINHTHDDRYYTETETNNLLNQRLSRSISGNRTTKCMQDLLNIKVITSDASGTNAVSGLDNYLIFHNAVDIRDPSNMYCFTVGFVNGGQYRLAQISNKALSIATNSVGTVAVQGGEAAFVKQVFIAIPQIGAATL